MAAAVCKLGLAADPAGGRVVFQLRGLAPGIPPDATHLLFVALKLLVQCSKRNQKGCPLVEHHKLFILEKL